MGSNTFYLVDLFEIFFVVGINSSAAKNSLFGLLKKWNK